MGKADPPNNNKKTSILASSSFRNQLQFWGIDYLHEHF